MVERREDEALGGTPPFITPPRESIPSCLPSVLTVDMELRRRREIFSLQHRLKEEEDTKRKRSPCSSSKAPPLLPDLDDCKKKTGLPLLLPSKKSRREETVPSTKILQRRSFGDSGCILLIESTNFTLAGLTLKWRRACTENETKFASRFHSSSEDEYKSQAYSSQSPSFGGAVFRF